MSFQTLIPLPSVITGTASNIASAGATVAGKVNPDGFATTYAVQYGTTSQYGYSVAGSGPLSGNSNVAVKLALAGLAPNTLYHYRVTATNGGGTAVGTDRTFQTAQAPRKSSGLHLRVTGPARVKQALAHGLQVMYSCDGGCLASFTVSVEPGGAVSRDGGSFPITVVRRSVVTDSGRSTSTNLPFTAADQSRLGGSRSLELTVSGTATSDGGEPSPVVTQLVHLS